MLIFLKNCLPLNKVESANELSDLSGRRLPPLSLRLYDKECLNQVIVYRWFRIPPIYTPGWREALWGLSVLPKFLGQGWMRRRAYQTWDHCASTSQKIRYRLYHHYALTVLARFFSICRHCILLLHWYRFWIRLHDWWIPFGHHWRVVDVPSEWRSNIDRTRSMCFLFCDNKTAWSKEE